MNSELKGSIWRGVALLLFVFVFYAALRSFSVMRYNEDPWNFHDIGKAIEKERPWKDRIVAIEVTGVNEILVLSGDYNNIDEDSEFTRLILGDDGWVVVE